MPSSYTTNLGLEKIAIGEQAGSWGTTVNTNMDIVDSALNGILSVTLAATGSSGSPNALAISDGAVSAGHNAWVTYTDGGDLGGDSYVQLTPNDAERLIWITNSLSGARSLYLFQGTYDAGRDYVLANGATALISFNGGGAGASTAASISGSIANGVDNLTSAEVTQLANIGATVISAADWVAVSNLSGTNTGDQTITLTGDVTGTGTGSFATTLAAGVVDTAELADNGVTLAKLEHGTQGDILYYGASGAPTRLGYGVSGQVLSTQGVGANPQWITQSSGVTDHTLLSNIGSNTHAQIDTHIANSQAHIDWTGTTSNLSTSGSITGGSLTANNITIDGNTISSTGGTDLFITPLAGEQLILDNTIIIDAGVVTGATSITSTTFVGALNGNASTATTAGTVTTAAQTAITSLGTLTTLTVDNITVNGAAITSNTGAISFDNENLSTTGTLASGALTVTGAITATGDITAYYTSDMALKQNIEPITGALDKVMALVGSRFEYRQEKEGKFYGLMAQDVQKVLPELVQTNAAGALTIRMAGFELVALLIEAIKELAEKVDGYSQ